MHAMHNPGSVFQAYALQKYLLNCNYDVKIIDYRPKYFYTESKLVKYFIKKILYFRSYHSRAKKFDSFISNNMSLTKRFSNYRKLCHTEFGNEVFVVGSDQLWNTDYSCGKDEAYYLSFIDKGKKVSYSTSVGKDPIDCFNIGYLEKRLLNFDYLSVREKSTAVSLSSNLRKKVEWVCDPVFLIDKKEYLAFFKAPLVDKKYVLVYLSESSCFLDLLVNKYKTKGYFIVLAGGFSKRCYCDLHIKDVGPEDFVNLIFYSECVISSSFHATAFSLIFHKTFFTIPPDKNGERIKSILECAGLISRCSNFVIDRDYLSEIIVWEEVDRRIEPYITLSKDYLKKAIE